MKDLTRFSGPRDDELESLLLEAGRSDEPPHAWYERMLSVTAGAGALLGTKTAAAGATASINATTLSIGTVLKWFSMGALVGLASSGTYVVVRGEPTAVSPTALVSHSLAQPAARDKQANFAGAVAEPHRASDGRSVMNQAPPLAREQRIKSPVSHVGTDQLGKHEARPSSSGATQSVAASQPVAPSEPESIRDRSLLGEQSMALKQAKLALDRGAFAEALQAIDSYRVRFTQRYLEPEAAVIEMEAQLALGNSGRARQLATQLVESGSPNARRARQILEGAQR
jgi:hypothetical protein